MLEAVAFTILAILVDLTIGDPPRIPHPVILMGRWISFYESWALKDSLSSARSPRREKLLGIGLVVSLILLVAGTIGPLLFIVYWVHPWLYAAISVWFISTTIAVKGLRDAAREVLTPLRQGNLQEARVKVGYIVGRDTNELRPEEVSRATVETVAENMVDAVVSPLFYAVWGGPVFAMVYRAVNTLDSMVGYKNDRYRDFGWASARLDDAMNYIPARLTGILLAAIAFVHPRLKGLQAVRTWWRDAGKHPSPNSGIPESVVAGALGIQLGGRNSYGGNLSDRARMGEALRSIDYTVIQQTNALLYQLAGVILGILVAFSVTFSVGWLWFYGYA
jgi:adenosylcobinamide-phosphate synthase